MMDLWQQLHQVAAAAAAAKLQVEVSNKPNEMLILITEKADFQMCED